MKEEKSLKRRIIENLFFSETTAIISRVGALIFTIIVARIFMPELFGVYSLALTIILSILVLSDLGLGSTITRYLADSIGKNKKTEARSRFLFLLKTKLLLSIITSILLFLFAGIVAGFFKKPELILPLKIGSIYLFLNTLYNLSTAVFLSFQKVKYSAIGEAIFQISKIIFLVVLVFFVKSVEGIFIVLSLSLILSLGFSTGVIAKKFPSIVKGKKIPVERRRMIKFSGFLAMSSMTLLIFANVDKLVLGYYLSTEFVGFYNAILTVVVGVIGIFGISPSFFPVFTQLSGKKLRNAFRKIFHYLSIIAFPATVGLAFIIVPLLKILYGVAYVPPEYEFSIFLASLFLTLLILESTFSSIYKVLLDADERPNIPAWTLSGTSILNLVLNIILVASLAKINPSYGLIGASLATFVSRYLGMFIFIHFAGKTMGVSLNKSSIFKPLVASLLMLGYLFLFKFVIPLNIITGIIMILSEALIYFTILFLIKGLSFGEIKQLFNRGHKS